MINTTTLAGLLNVLNTLPQQQQQLPESNETNPELRVLELKHADVKRRMREEINGLRDLYQNDAERKRELDDKPWFRAILEVEPDLYGFLSPPPKEPTITDLLNKHIPNYTALQLQLQQQQQQREAEQEYAAKMVLFQQQQAAIQILLRQREDEQQRVNMQQNSKKRSYSQCTPNKHSSYRKNVRISWSLRIIYSLFFINKCPFSSASFFYEFATWWTKRRLSVPR